MPKKQTKEEKIREAGTWFISYLAAADYILNDDEIQFGVTTADVLKDFANVKKGMKVFLKMKTLEHIEVIGAPLETVEEWEEEESEPWWEQPFVTTNKIVNVKDCLN